MPPLTRQRTPQSLHSEWSRSTLGATISIHALAKPLMKVMYHRVVLDLIKSQRGIPLSAETMEIYASYLGWKYVAEVTKGRILDDISNRLKTEAEVAASQVDARLVAHFLPLYDTHWESTNAMVKTKTSSIFGLLAFHSLTRGAVLALQPSARLVPLLRDGNHNVVQLSCWALMQISRDLDGARAIMEAGGPGNLQHLLKSRTTLLRRWSAWTLGRIAVHPSTRGSVVVVQPCARLVVLLSDEDADTVRGACHALSEISEDVDAARAVVKAGALDFVQHLLESREDIVRIWSLRILGWLAFHPSTRGAVFAVEPCVQLVALLRDYNQNVVEGACHALSQIARNLDGARAVVEAGALDLVKLLLESWDTGVRRRTTWLLGRLAFHSPTSAAVVAVQSCAQLVALLRHHKAAVVEGACYALSQISQDPGSARTVLASGALELVPELIESPGADVQKYTCLLLAQLAHHDRVPPATLGIHVPPMLGLLRTLCERMFIVPEAQDESRELSESAMQPLINSGASTIPPIESSCIRGALASSQLILE